jgi:hypothetical protein
MLVGGGSGDDNTGYLIFMLLNLNLDSTTSCRPILLLMMDLNLTSHCS